MLRCQVWSAALLLLAVCHLVDSAGDAIEAQEGSRFNFTACKERICFVNKGCNEVNEGELVKYDDDKPCKILLAVWPYSEIKWRISIEGNVSGVKEVKMRVLDDNGDEKSKIVTCSKAEDKISITPELDTHKIEPAIGWYGEDLIHCDFTFQTKPNMKMALSFGILDNFELDFGMELAKKFKLDWNTLFGAIKNSAELCNPDMIQFDESLKKEGQRVLRVKDDDFTLACPKDYQLMFSNATGSYRAEEIKCELKDPQATKKIYGYKITTLPLHEEIGPLPNTDKFNAHCVQTVCSLCPNVACTPTASSTCPNYTASTGEGICANLTCEGNRFSVDGRTIVGKARCEAEGWTIDSVKYFMSASCIKHASCRSAIPLTCDGTCEVSEGGVRCIEAGHYLVGANHSSTDAVRCDNQTAKWQWNGTTLPQPTTFTCNADGRPLAARGARLWVKILFSLIVVALYVGGGVLLCLWGDAKYGIGDDEENFKMTPEIKALLEYAATLPPTPEELEEERLLQEARSRQQQTSSSEPSGVKRRRPADKEEPEKPETTDRPAAPKPPPMVEHHQPQPQLQLQSPPPAATSSKRPQLPQMQQSSQPPSTDGGGYEVIPNLEMPSDKVPEPSARTAVAIPAAPRPSGSGSADGYEEIGLNGDAPLPPPAPKDEEQYVMIEPKSRTPPPPPRATGSQEQLLQPAADGTPQRAASMYYANSKGIPQ